MTTTCDMFRRLLFLPEYSVGIIEGVRENLSKTGQCMSLPRITHALFAVFFFYVAIFHI